MRYLLTVALVLLGGCVSEPALSFEEMAEDYCARTVADCTDEMLMRHADLVAIGCEPESYDEMRCRYESDAVPAPCASESNAVAACERRGCEAEFDAQWECWSAAAEAGSENPRAECPDENAAVLACLDARAE